MDDPRPPCLWQSLTPAHQQEILDHVEGCLMVTPTRTLNTVTSADYARWAIEGLGRTSLVEDAFGQGFEAGRQAMHDEIAALADA